MASWRLFPSNRDALVNFRYHVGREVRYHRSEWPRDHLQSGNTGSHGRGLRQRGRSTCSDLPSGRPWPHRL